MAMTGRSIALAVVVSLAGGFLVGFVPGCMRTGDLQSRLARAEQAASFATARDLACMLHVEIANRNFGNAADLSTRLFDHVRTLAGQTNERDTRDRLQQILNEREAISSGLAKNDAGLEQQVRGIVQQLHRLGPSAIAGGS